MVPLVDEDKERNFLFNLQTKESIGRNMQRLLCETTQDLTDEIVQMALSGRKRKSGALMIIKLLRRFWKWIYCMALISQDSQPSFWWK